MQNRTLPLALFLPLFFLLLSVSLQSFEPDLARGLYRWTIPSQPPRGSDAIVIFGGGGGFRIERGLELLSKGYAPELLVLGNRDELEFAKSLAGALGHSNRRILAPHRFPADTFEAVEILREWAAWKQPDRMLLVSEGPHLLRIQALLENLGGLGARFLGIDSQRPWSERSSEHRRRLYLELLKGLAVEILGTGPIWEELSWTWNQLDARSLPALWT